MGMEMARKVAVGMRVALYRLWHEERGAQTLEWLALALLILAILGTVTAAAGQNSFGEALRAKFLSLVEKIDK